MNKRFKQLAIAFSMLSGAYASNTPDNTVQDKLAKLEKSFNGKIGVYAIDTTNNQVVQHRATERFPVQSTLKFITAADLLKQSSNNPKLLQEKIHYSANDLIKWHPITGLYTEMTLESLAEAAVSYSDNPAVNLIIKRLGGPDAITSFAHSIGNTSFNVKHYDGFLNSTPNNDDDTSTPKDMAISVQQLTLGQALTKPQQTKLITWMVNNTTGYNRIRAGVPIGWVVGEKTGSGDYGVANDIGIAYSPLCKPIVLAIYTTQTKPQAKRRDDIIASTTQIVFDEFAKHNNCFKALFN